MTTVRDELMHIFNEMGKYDRSTAGHDTARHVQALLRCAATHLALPALPGTAPLTANGNRVYPACRGCQTAERRCHGRPEFTQDKHGKPFPGQLTMFPPDYEPPQPVRPTFF